MMDEWRMWHLYYLPDIPTGKNIVDMGAGSGETAQMYFNHGVGRVIMFESDPDSIEMIRKNFPDLFEVPSSAKAVLIPLRIDHVKVDIEGAERNMIVETHYWMRFRRVLGSPAVGMWRVEDPGFWTWILTWTGLMYFLHQRRIQIAHWIRTRILK